MKNKNKTWICLLIIGFLYSLSNSCKKDDNNNNTPFIPSVKEIVFNPNLTYDTLTDFDNNVYKTIKIGTQKWMAENLRVTKYNNGDFIATTAFPESDITNENSPKYQWSYKGNESIVHITGREYTWYAVTDNRKVCPFGWHLPNNSEWVILINYLGGDSIAVKLKEKGWDHWNPGVGTNESGFTDLPVSPRYSDLLWYDSFGIIGIWWSSSENSISDAYSRYLDYFNEDLFNLSINKKDGLSIRCVKDSL